MESAPLTQAYAAARNASYQQVSNLAPAASERFHEAAHGFASAAHGVDDFEALRVLNLLEQQHLQLAQIVNGRTGQYQSSASHKTEEPLHSANEPFTDASQMKAGNNATTTPTAIYKRPSSPVLQRRPARDPSSSIANNLANARGIPQGRRRDAGTSLEPTASPSSKQVLIPNAQLGKNKVPELASKLQEPPKPAEVRVQAIVQDEPFQKFYSTFEGLLSKLSAPLAFAGLPLIADEPSQAPKDPSPQPIRQSLRSLSKATASSIPDVSKIFSKAALRAVKEENPGFGGIQESFLVVPTGGGTVSYANILARAERDARRDSMDAPPERDEDTRSEQFVDASESPHPRSPKVSRKFLDKSSKGGKTYEELEIENESLKKVTDNLSRRLYMWEKSAQSQSMALQQSVRQLKPNQVPPDTTSSNSSDDRMKSVEEQLLRATKELEHYGRENEKLKTVVARYRERWEKLKEGARVRREEGRTGTPDHGPKSP